MGLALDTIDFIERLVIWQGARAGERFVTLPWQRDFIRGVLDPSVQMGALSVARANGKSTLVGALGAAALCGPMAQPGADIVVVASSFRQAKIVGDHVAYFLEPFIADDPRWSVVHNQHQVAITNRETKTRLIVIASDPRRAHGLAASLILCDEPAQWPRTTSDGMFSALGTGFGKIGGEKLIALGTRPSSADHWFQQLLNGGADFASCYSVEDDDEGIYARDRIAEANPSMEHIDTLWPSIEREVDRILAGNASDQDIQKFRSLRLNAGIDDVATSLLIDPETWRRCEAQDAERDGPCVWGIDLGATAAMSAVAAYWPETGKLETLAAFPDTPTLDARGIRDHVADLYCKMAERGELIVCPGRTVDPAALIYESMQRFGGAPVAVTSDRWREGELLDALEGAGVPPSRWSPRGMGFRDGGDDVRRFRRACAEGRVAAPAESLAIRSALSGAITVSDPAGNHKIAKNIEGGRSTRHRDDMAVAIVLAVGEGDRMRMSQSAATYAMPAAIGF